MLIVWYFDWNGTIERLREYDEAHKKMVEKTRETEFLGRFVPWNKKYQWAYIIKTKGLVTWSEMFRSFEWESESIGKLADEESSGEFELFGGPRN